MRNSVVAFAVSGVFLLGFFGLTHIVSAQFFGPLVPCGNGTNNTNECTVCHLLALAQNIINFLVSASVLVAALMFLNAGVLYVLSSANPGNISKAHSIFTKTLIGLIIILSAWLIVNVIMETLYDGDWTQMFDMCSTYT